MSFNEKVEISGEYLGRKILRPTLNYLRNDFTEKFNIDVSGIENLQTIIDQPHIFFSNHNSLKNKNKDSGLRPDHLFIFKEVYDAVDKKLAIVGQTDKGPNMKNKDEKFLIPLVEGIYKGAENIISVRNGPNKLNRDFIKEMNEFLDRRHQSVLIFPQVVGDIDYNSTLPFKSGIYHVFKNRQKQVLSPVPLIPVCIYGCDSWKPYKNQQIKIRFGKSFYFPENANKDEVVEIMKNKISEIRSEM